MKTWPISIPSHLFILCCCSSLKYPFHVRSIATTKFQAGFLGYAPTSKLNSAWKHCPTLEPPTLLNCWSGSWHSFGLCQTVPSHVYGLALPRDPFWTGSSDTVNLFWRIRDFNSLIVDYSMIVGLTVELQSSAHLFVLPIWIQNCWCLSFTEFGILDGVG